jgi:RNA polymerase sigma factor (TIGR02999 family)
MPTDPASPPQASRSAAVDRLIPLVYEELRAIARRALRGERAGHTLTTTALVHEAYLRLAAPSNLDGQDRARFLAAAAVAMRRVLIDYAREQSAQKRGGRPQRVSLSAMTLALPERAETLLALDESLLRLGARRPRLAEVVDCRYFGGMTEEETAAALGITSRTVQRDWAKARAWLAEDLGLAWEQEA